MQQVDDSVRGAGIPGFLGWKLANDATATEKSLLHLQCISMCLFIMRGGG